MKDIRLCFRPKHTQDRLELKKVNDNIFYAVSAIDDLPESSIVQAGLTTESDLGLVAQIIFYDVEKDKVNNLIKLASKTFDENQVYAFYDIDDSQTEDKILYKKY